MIDEPKTVQVPGKLLELVGQALAGERWQTALARELGVTDRTTQRWAQAAREDRPYQVSRSLVAEMLGLLEKRADAAPRAFDLLRGVYEPD